MANQEENLLHIGADLEADIVSRFRSQTHERRFKKKEVLRSLTNFWLSLKPDFQRQLYHGSLGSELRQILEPSVLAAIDDESVAAHTASKPRRKRDRLATRRAKAQ
jgi:hypothetical protein